MNLFFFIYLAIASNSYGQDFQFLTHESLGKGFEEKASLKSDAKSFLVDGNKNFPDTGSNQYHRTLLNLFQVSGNLPVQSKSMFRFGGQMASAYQKEHGEDLPRKVSKEQWYVLRPRADFALETESGALAFIGVFYHYYSSRTRKSETVSFSSNWQYESVSQIQPYLGVIKKANRFDGGFFYKIGVEKSRSLVKSTSLESTKFTYDDIIHEPTTLGLFVLWKGPNFNLLGEFQSIESGEGGVKNESGRTIYEDYNQINIKIDFPGLFADLDLGVAGRYKSLSYASNLNVAMESIPMRLFSVDVATVVAGLRYWGGIYYGRGKNRQSLPEMNADYNLSIYGINAGVGFEI